MRNCKKALKKEQSENPIRMVFLAEIYDGNKIGLGTTARLLRNAIFPEKM